MKRIASYLLLAAMALSVFASCSDTPVPSDTTASDTAETTSAQVTETTTEAVTEDMSKDSLPAGLEFGGTEIGIISNINTNFHGYLDVVATDDKTSILDETIYERNRSVEDRLKIKIVEKTGKAANVEKEFRALVAAADDTYSISHFADRTNFALAVDGHHLDMKEFKYIDFDKDYWFKEANDLLNLTGKQYVSFGDMSLGSYDYTYLLGFNQQMLTDNNLKSPYEYYDENNWTFDTFGQLSAAVKKDLNGDGVMDLNDRYGYQARDGAMYPLMYTAAGLKTVVKNDKGSPTFTMNQNQAFFDVYDWCTTNFVENGSTYLKSTSTHFVPQEPLFPEDKVLFVSLSFYYVGAVRDMKSDFGIIVYPKYKADQERYYSWCAGGVKSVAVSKVTAKQDAIGAMLEAMGSKSLETVIPAYYEINLKTKYSRDEISSRMFDVIRDTRTFDLGDNVWFSQVRSVLGNAFRDRLPLASTVASIESAVNTEIQKAMQNLK